MGNLEMFFLEGRKDEKIPGTLQRQNKLQLQAIFKNVL